MDWARVEDADNNATTGREERYDVSGHGNGASWRGTSDKERLASTCLSRTGHLGVDWLRLAPTGTDWHQRIELNPVQSFSGVLPSSLLSSGPPILPFLNWTLICT